MLKLLQFQPRAQIRTLWSPTLAAPLFFWIDASDTTTVTSSGGYVSQINDKGPNGYNFSQGTASKQPQYGLGQNSRFTLVFNSDFAQVLNNATLTYTSNTFHVFGVQMAATSKGSNAFGRVLSLTNSGNGQDADNTSSFIFTRNGGNNLTIYRNSAAIGQQNETLGTWYIFDGQRDQTNVKLALNGGTYSTGTTAAANQNINRAAIGASWQTGIQSIASWDGQIGEIIMVAYIPTQTVIDKFQGYLAWKWGLQGSLPVGHPYKNSPPLA